MNLSFEENPKEILEELLKYHDVSILRGYLNSSVRKKEPRPNNHFEVSTKVYFEKYKNESTLKWAKQKVADEVHIGVATVETHIENYRKYLKEEMKKIKNYNEDINTFIDGYIKHIRGKSHYWDGEKWEYTLPSNRELREYFNEYKDELFITYSVPTISDDDIPF